MAHIQKKVYISERTGKTNVYWQARYTAPDGRERSKRFARKSDAERWLDANCGDIARGIWIDPNAGKVRFVEYADEWLGVRKDLRPSTRAKYRQLLDNHLDPRFGSTQLLGITPSAVRKWHATLSASHPATAASAYRLLSTICKTAVEDEVIAKSPCRVKGAAAERAKERPIASPAEVKAAIATTPVHLQAAVVLAVWCQLRRGEVLGMQRGDVNLAEATVDIRRTWTTVPTGEVILGPPKTEAGRRTISFPPPFQSVLQDHLDRFVGHDTDAWMFPGEDPSYPNHPRTLNHMWDKVREKIDRPDLRFHDLRHTGLTFCAWSGASTAELMRRAGHASPAAALRYQHATDGRDRVLANALGEMAVG